jgi:ketosteroid isomerase-like protein
LINRGEFDAVARQHTLDMSMFMSEFDSRVVLNSPLGLAAMRCLDGAKPQWAPRDIQVQVLGGSAVTSYYMDGSTRWSDGTTDARPRRVTEVWVKANGTWKEAHHHDSVYTPTAAVRAAQ